MLAPCLDGSGRLADGQYLIELGLQLMIGKSGTLYIVATPIGNLDDFSQRAIQVLGLVNCIYAEDTRHSKTLMQHYDISTQLQSLHEHNETSRITEIEARLRAGDDLALISDAGTPLLSDPGYRVVEYCINTGLSVSPVPGASALLAALCVSGQAVDSFVYCGFPPSKKSARADYLAALASEPRTLIFFESRHRIESTVELLIKHFGAQRSMTMARELTKRFESINKATLAEHLMRLQSGEEASKGEFVLVVAGREVLADSEEEQQEELRRVLGVLLDHLGARSAAECAASITGCRKNHAYQVALAMGKNDDS